MSFESKHENYKFKNINKHYRQKISMSNYLYENCNKDDMFMFLSHQSWYDDFIKLQNELYEGLITSYPYNEVKNILKRFGYNVVNVSFFLKDIKDKFNIYIEKGEDDISFNNLYNKMKKYGYYYVGETYVSKNEEVIYCYCFSPKFPQECTEEVYSNNMILYHLTNDYYIDKILKDGLTPRTQNKIEKEQPNRVYFGIKKMTANGAFVKQMYSKMKSHKNKPINNLYILKIDLSKCEDKRFFYDYFTPNGVFTYENIPPQCISIEEEINVRDL